MSAAIRRDHIIDLVGGNRRPRAVHFNFVVISNHVFAQAGKCRVPTIVFACDTAPELETEAPKGMVRVYPRRIDLENTCRLKSFDATEVVESLDELEQSLARRKRELATHG